MDLLVHREQFPSSAVPSNDSGGYKTNNSCRGLGVSLCVFFLGGWETSISTGDSGNPPGMQGQLTELRVFPPSSTVQNGSPRKDSFSHPGNHIMARRARCYTLNATRCCKAKPAPRFGQNTPCNTVTHVTNDVLDGRVGPARVEGVVHGEAAHLRSASAGRLRVGHTNVPGVTYHTHERYSSSLVV